MDIDNKALTKLMKTTSAALKRDHGIAVPHSALRASILTALGENPHAFSQAKTAAVAGDSTNQELQALIEEAPHYFHPLYDFDGKKLEWLKRAKLVPSKPSVSKAAIRANQKWEERTFTLYLVTDEIGVMNALAMDSGGRFRIPESVDLSYCSLQSIDAQLPRISEYGFPDYLSNAKEFFRSRFGLETSARTKVNYKDLGDDSGDTCELVVHVDDVTCRLLSETLFRTYPELEGELAEWVGVNYRRNYDTESIERQKDWLKRFLRAVSEQS